MQRLGTPSAPTVWLIALAFTATVGACDDGEPNGLLLTGIVRELDLETFSAEDPIADVQVCQFASNNCTVSDSVGEYALPLLFDREVQVSYEKSGFGAVLIAYRTEREDIRSDALLATDAALSEFATDLGVVYPPTDSGWITATVFRGAPEDDLRLEGAALSLIGSDGVGFYLDQGGMPDTSLLATGNSGTGGFVSVEPVEVTLEVRGSAVNCSSGQSWVADGTNRFRLPVREGFSTQTIVSCP